MDKESRLTIKNIILGIITAILISAITTISAPAVMSVALWIDIMITPDSISNKPSNEFDINIINHGLIQGKNTLIQIDYNATSNDNNNGGDSFSLISDNIIDDDCIEGNIQFPDEKSKQALLSFLITFPLE